MDRPHQRTCHINVDHSQQTTCTVDECKLFPLRIYADHRVEKVFRSIEKLTKAKKKNIQIVGGDFDAELGPGFAVERVSVGPHTLKQERRLDEAIADDRKLHSTQHDVQKTLEKQATHRTPKGTEKTVGLHIGAQETYVLQQRR